MMALKQGFTNSPIALLGDVGHVQDPDLFRLFRKLLNHYEVVFYLLGNHDPYQLTMQVAKTKVRKFEQEMANLNQSRTTGKFVFLDQTRYDLTHNITILGCTLFSHITDKQKLKVGSVMVDFKDTKDWTVDDHNEAHHSDVDWLNAEVTKITAEQPQREVVIFTHHSPCTDPRASNPKHRGSDVSSGFVTDLSREECWVNPKVRMWAFGHTHYNCDFVDDATGKKIVTNQKGYAKFRAQEGFDMETMYLLPEGKTYRVRRESETQPTNSGSSTSTRIGKFVHSRGLLGRMKARLCLLRKDTLELPTAE